MPPQSAACVLELGMSHAGEIAELAYMCEPTVRLVLNAGPAHLEGLGSVEAVARAKGELFDTAQEGDTCIVNADDFLVSKLPVPAGTKIMRFGTSAECDVMLVHADVTHGGFGVRVRIEAAGPTSQSADVALAIPGRHLALNVCAAATVALALGVPVEVAAKSIGAYVPVGMRTKLESVLCKSGQCQDKLGSGEEDTTELAGPGRKVDDVVSFGHNDVRTGASDINVARADRNGAADVSIGSRAAAGAGSDRGGAPGTTEASDWRDGWEAREEGAWASRIWLINDAYNANPMSVKAALHLLADVDCPPPGRRIALLGDMLELGRQSVAWHESALAVCGNLGIDLVGVAGENFLIACEGARKGEGGGVAVWRAKDSLELAAIACGCVRGGDVVLVKGSRGMKMEKVIGKLRTFHATPM